MWNDGLANGWYYGTMSNGKKTMDSMQKLLEAAEGPSAKLKAALEKSDGLKALTRQSDQLAELSARQFAVDDVLMRTIEPIQLRNATFENSMNDIVNAVNMHEEAARLALGPIQDMRSLVHNDAIQAIMDRHQDFAQIGERLQAQFRMPAIGEAARLASEMQESIQSAMQPFIAQSAAITAAMESIRTPWLDTIDAVRSARSFASLQNIGATLAQHTAFSDSVTGSLRDYLGDWRDKITFSDEIIRSISARSDLYESRGFDTGLTEFPNPAFEGALSEAGLWEPVPDIEIVPALYLPAPSEQEEPGFARTNRAHDHLQRFEAHVRQFIEKQMCEVFGDNWIKHRVPHDFRKRWKDNQDKARDNGAEVFPLIEYADFTDYEIIIVRGDNWNDVFQSIFRRKESVRESWQRLYPIRLATMHARMISQDDELYLVAEVKRILKAVGVI